MSYVNCPDCNQKALSVATRCPRCGLAFEGRFAPPPAPPPRRIGPVLLLTGGLAAILVGVNFAVREFGAAPAGKAPVAKAPVAKAPGAQATGAKATGETAPVATAPEAREPEVSEGMVPPPRAESLPAAPARQPEPEPQPVVVATPPVVRPVLEPEPAQMVAGESRYASTWVNVRAGRSPSAPVLRTLEPGELVAVDTPRQGWYRVVTEDQAAGYVDGRFLDTAPPGESP